MIFYRKNTLRDDISTIIEKDDIYPRKYGISSDSKIKDDKKVYSSKKGFNDYLCFYVVIL